MKILSNTILFLLITNFTFAQYTPKKDEIKYLEDHKKLRLSLRGGMSFLTGSNTGEANANLSEAREQMQSGLQYGADLYYFTSEFTGWGIKFASFQSSATTTVSVLQNNSASATKDYAENMVNLFYGPSFTTRILSNNAKNIYTLGFAMGYVDYTNRVNFFGDDFVVKSNAFGLTWTAGWDLMFSQNLGIGLALSYTMGTLSRFTADGASSTQLTSLNETLSSDISRFEVTLGLSIYK
ncbi:hypothetical protein [Microscilla marina]|uniref:Outer membrane protein beta-barrel domain-containing protein n=1 Tax=Microscilla marina ATCC 23134 TaxID=313606 RepID=A1ZPI9_MICM2|nr:hypothetical protein [Microscilla marina]EAY27728.1 hypothetical protein M23134_03797 [Microscilla marina ATCC 23134]